jgi:hypothetical protein
MSGQRWLSFYTISRPVQVRRDHPRNRRYRGINSGALPGFSILIFHAELQIEKKFVPADVNKFIGNSRRLVHALKLIHQYEQIKNSCLTKGVTISHPSHFVIPPADPAPPLSPPPRGNRRRRD